ncbi:hypothetical protein K435DRAFT_880841 [Dendrothele bispora CBS 962.96]|uniref:Uncharacterized protein n=1 Tax=Dendrothele bispora (strain CBS 962.96) TaxID=1314807 RepID=A0A4S8KIZ1_DENBC|nr:hypothetical protein K435DRAFT_880841 [Dendrothele bispora CBS 962.96]
MAHDQSVHADEGHHDDSSPDEFPTQTCRSCTATQTGFLEVLQSFLTLYSLKVQGLAERAENRWFAAT